MAQKASPVAQKPDSIQAVDVTRIHAVDSIRIPVPGNAGLPLAGIQPGGRAEEPAAEQEHIVVFRYKKVTGFNRIMDDSTRRWTVRTTPSEWAENQPGAITYRLGVMGFHDAVDWLGHSEQSHELYVDGLRLNNPVTGNVNSQLAPQYMLNFEDQDTYGVSRITRLKTQNFYLTRPLTRADYVKAGFGYRVLNVLLTRNITRSWNVASYYWVRSEDGAYPNEKFRGRQAWGRVTHFLSPQYVVNAQILYNGLQLHQPGGYVIPDMDRFSFDRLNTTSIWGGSGLGSIYAHSSVRNTIASINIEARRDTLHPVTSRLELFYNTYRRFFDGQTAEAVVDGRDQTFPADSTYYRVNQIGAFLEHQTDIRGIHLYGRGQASWFTIPPPGELSVERTHWGQLDLQGRMRLPVTRFFSVEGTGAMKIRTDDRREAHYSVRATLKPNDRWFLKAAASGGTILPTVQQLYWRGNLYHGSDRLKTPGLKRLDGEIRFTPNGTLTLGLRAYRQSWNHPVHLDESGTFVNTDNYSVEGGTGWIKWVNSSWEADLSTTVEQYQSPGYSAYTRWLSKDGPRFWNRFDLFRKEYLFNHATFVKAGLSFLYSPLGYAPPHYYPELDLWNYRTDTSPIPPFYRLNLELSARVRMLMVYFKVENVLDGLSQPGYFETADYPMPPRRLFFGIRAIIRD